MTLPKVWDESGYTRQLHPTACSISLTLQPVSSVNMTLTQVDDISVLDWVAVPVPDGSVMYCRVASVSRDAASGEQSVYMEQGACVFDDTLLRAPAGQKQYTMKDTIANILGAIVSGNSRWAVGTVEATETIYIDLTDRSPMTAMVEMMQSIPGYQMEFVQASDVDWHIDVKRRSTEPTCEARLSRNLKSCDISYSTDSMCTRVYADGLDGGYMDSVQIQRYGVHEQTMGLNDGLSKAQKEAIVQAYLNAHDHPSVSVSISGVELSQVTGLPIDRFEVGAVCRVAIPWLDLVVDDVIVDKRYSDPYKEPEAVSFSLANATPDLTIAIAAVTGGGGGGGGGAVKVLQRYNTKFEQTDEYFRLLATDTQWDEMEQGTVTAYGQIVLTSNSVQQVVSSIGSNGRVTAASIALAINEQGSNAMIDADKIRLTGDTTVAGMLSVSGGSLAVAGGIDTDGTIMCDDLEADTSIFAPRMNTNRLDIPSDGACYLPATDVYIGSTDVSNLIVDASVSGNTLTLTKRDGTTVNFNKAATATIAGSWSSGTYTVRPTSGSTNTLSTTVSISGSNNITSNGIYTYNVMYEDEHGDDQETGSRFTVAVNVDDTSYSARVSRYTLKDNATDDRRIYIKKNGQYMPVLSQSDYVYIVSSGSTIPNSQIVKW